jgi:ligand-binding SRPBCC domain-containing protein
MMKRVAASAFSACNDLSLTTIVIETFIAAPPEACFDLALDVGAHARSAAFSDERVVEPGRLTGVLQLGDLVTFEGRHFGFRQRFTTRITELIRPQVFVDEMVHGAFKSLRHVHEFVPKEGGTLMRDTLEWKAWGLGFLLKPHMRWFVTTKQRALKLAIQESR